ncbi:MAG TPA: cation:proton antiporter, partial [Chloroflexia bacterium]|nr:cation:proton antiporter [Chloroflexia bacterium]
MDSLVFNLWYLVAGALLVVMALGGSVLKRLPLTTSILYLAVGFALGQHGAGLIDIDPLEESGLLERLTEVAVIISVFTAGLKLRAPLSRPRWFIPVRLAFLSMTITVGLITLVGVAVLGLPVGVAVLLGAILAPTDPVLASDVQLEHPFDRDKLKFGLTGEAGLNDGAAFPFVMLGLGLLGLHDIGDFGWRWFAIDVVWAIIGGLAVGGLLGTIVGRLVIYLRKNHKEALGLDDFLALGLIALSYGVALMAHTYGFLAVFAAGLALRRIEMLSSGDKPPEEVMAVTRAVENEEKEEIATDPEKASAYMAEAVLGFNEQLERIGEVGVVVLVGGLLTWDLLPLEAWWFVPLLFLVIRPISVEVGLIGSSVAPLQRRLMSWFGIRGIGSVYYLMYAIHNGVPGPAAQQLLSIVLTVVAVSVVVHGLSVTPL